MIHLFAAGFHFIDLFHPLRYWGYQFWSGIGSDLGELTIVTGMAAISYQLYRNHTCHIQKCYRISWHPHPDHGHPVCKKHFKEDGTAHEFG